MSIDTFRNSYRHITEIPVAWGEMDALGHVNNVSYFRYFETARIAYFNALDLEVPRIARGIGPILAQIDCQYKMPVTFPDTLLVGTTVYEIGNTSFKVRHEIFSRAQNQVIASSGSVLVLIDYGTGQKIPITGEMRDSVAKMEGN